ncbi:MAG: ABC transporter ATP-binding protein [Halobacteria archaeon]
MKAVDTDGLTKKYNEVRALDTLDLTVEKGELFGFIGPNGAGKTTTIEILTGQTQPTEGTAWVLDIDPTAEPVKTRSKIGILPEREDPPSFLTPREYLDFVAETRGMESHRSKVEEWSERLSFSDRLDTVNADLSRGQKQKVMFTQAFLHEPELVFIDEPLSNLDPVMQEEVKKYLTEFHTKGNTVFLSTHDINVAEKLCSKVGILYDGRLVAEKNLEELEHGDRSLIDVFMEEVQRGEKTVSDALFETEAEKQPDQ